MTGLVCVERQSCTIILLQEFVIVCPLLGNMNSLGPRRYITCAVRSCVKAHPLRNQYP